MNSPKKKYNFERLTEIFEMSFRKFSVPFDFEPEFSEILVKWNAPNNNITQMKFMREKFFYFVYNYQPKL